MERGFLSVPKTTNISIKLVQSLYFVFLSPFLWSIETVKKKKPIKKLHVLSVCLIILTGFQQTVASLKLIFRFSLPSDK